MSSKKIVFKISKDGNVVIDKLEGYGASCLEATKFLERALGNSDEASRRFTAEYNEPAETSSEEHLRH
jgi:hypothetical protein